MAENILGPSYSVKIMFEVGTDPRTVLKALQEDEKKFCDRLKKLLAELLIENFKTLVELFITQLGYVHDGYEFRWEVEPAVDFDADENDHPTADVYFGINVLCKDEDFDFFDDVLQREQFSDLYGNAVCDILRRCLEGSGINVSEKNVHFSESEFGYG